MLKRISYILTTIVLLCLCSCASQRKNNATTRMYHAFTARYNTYHNGNIAYKQAVKAQATSHKDNYLELLPLLNISNEQTQKAGASNYDRAIEKSQKAIKNHSIKRRPKKPSGKKLSQKQKRFYAQKEFNPFLWRAWFLMGNSQFRKGEFTEAASTYIYISKLYESNPRLVAQARIGLAKCYTEMEWLYEAEDLLQRLQRDTVPAGLKPDYAVAKANLLLKQDRGEEAIPHIKAALKRKGITTLDKAREHYLLGQLYAKAGNNKEAYKHFGKTISKSPPYEFEFNARIRQTETATNEKHKKTLRKLKRMAKSPKNEEYKSEIYYAIGNLHLSSKDTIEAIRAYETGIALGNGSGYGTGMLHLSLASIYWAQEKFSKAHENYSKALPMLGEKEGIEVIKLRSEALAGLVQYTDIVEEQSRLLHWATLTPKQLEPIFDGLIDEAKFQEKLKKEVEKRLKKQEGAGGSELDAAGNAADMSMPAQDNNGKQLWYFYNPQLVAQGVRAFKQKWGDRELKDYWRFSNEISSLMSSDIPMDSIAADSLMTDTTTVPGDTIVQKEIIATEEKIAADPTTREYYMQQIPDTEEEKEAAHAALKDALFEAGVRFKDDLNDKRLALEHLERIVEEYPHYERIADTYYQLFLACSRWEEPEKAALYKSLLMTHYPDSSYTKRIQDPNFFETAAQRKQREDSLYAEAYANYVAKKYDNVIEANSYSAEKYPNGSHRARFMFIDAMSKLYSDRLDEAIEALDALLTGYPADSISRIATDIGAGIMEGRLLNSGISTSIWDRKADGTIRSGNDTVPQFSDKRNEPFYFVLAFPNGSLDEKRLLFEMARYNFSRYMVRNFDMTFEKLAEVTLLEVKEFLNFDEAFLYCKRLYGNAATARLLEGINAFVISKNNLDLLLQHYTFDDYREFYEKNLLTIPEVEIDGYTLDEPDYESTVPEGSENEKMN